MRKPQGKLRSAKQAKRVRRKLSIRKTIVGTAERPRVCMNKTNKHIVVQVVNDDTNKTLSVFKHMGRVQLKLARIKKVLSLLVLQ